MRWPSFLHRNRGRAPRPLPVLPAGYDLDERLAAKKAGRPARNERSRKSAATKQHLAFERDRLRNDMVPL